MDTPRYKVEWDNLWSYWNVVDNEAELNYSVVSTSESGDDAETICECLNTIEYKRTTG